MLSFQGKNLFFTFYSIRVECEELFCKTNKNLKIYLFIKIIILTNDIVEIHPTISSPSLQALMHRFAA